MFSKKQPYRNYPITPPYLLRSGSPSKRVILFLKKKRTLINIFKETTISQLPHYPIPFTIIQKFEGSNKSHYKRKKNFFFLKKNLKIKKKKNYTPTTPLSYPIYYNPKVRRLQKEQLKKKKKFFFFKKKFKNKKKNR